MSSTPVAHRQTFTVTVTTGLGGRPGTQLHHALNDAEGVRDFRVISAGDVEEVPGPDRDRLIALAVWAAGEDAKRQLGLPSEWDQGDWLRRAFPDAVGNDCGTACCIAGKVALEDGGRPVLVKWDPSTDERIEVPWGELDPDAGWTTAAVRFPDRDEVVHASEYAEEVLGLTPSQAITLFSGSNNLNDVLRAVADILA